jgi:hypothetical protein
MAWYREINLADALLVAHSPSLWAILCAAVGAIHIGEDIFSPNTVVSNKMRSFYYLFAIICIV